MIRYALACDAGHRFDSWFGSGAAFDGLARQNLVTCPACGSPHVAKAIMAPALVAGRAASAQAGQGDAGAPAPALPAGNDLPDDGSGKLRKSIRAFREKVLAETQDVGGRFPEEARRMHEGDRPHRDIRGEATLEEARALLEDGILILPVPGAPEELN